MINKAWLICIVITAVLTGCGSGGDSDPVDEVVGPIAGDRIKKEEINNFLMQYSSATSTNLQLAHKGEFPYSTDTTFEPQIDTIFIGGAEGGGLNNDIVFGFSTIFPEGYTIYNGKCNPEIQLYLDTDMNTNTGYSIEGIGADVMVVGQAYWSEESSIYYYDNTSESPNYNVPSSTPGDSNWYPRVSQGNNGSIFSCIDGNTPNNTTVKYIVSAYGSSDLLSTESRGVVRTAYATWSDRVWSKTFYIPALTQPNQNNEQIIIETGIADVGNTINNAFFINYSLDTDIIIESKIDDENDIDMFSIYLASDGLYTFNTTGSIDTEGVIWNNLGEYFIHDYNSGTANNFSVTANFPAGEYYIQVESTNEEAGNYSLHAKKGGVVNQIDIIGTWDYEATVSDCYNMVEQGKAIWTYSHGEYKLTLQSNNGLDDKTCTYVGAYSATSNNGYLASNPISSSEFLAGMNIFTSNNAPEIVWSQIDFEATNRITLTGTSNTGIEAQITFTR